jgi:hypothetical protein
MLKFFIIFTIAIGCSSGAVEEESSNPPEFVDRTPASTADQIPTSTPVEDAPEDPEEAKLERPSEPEFDPEEKKEEELRPEKEPEQEEEEEQEQEEEEEDEEEIKYACFSYFDCPNHEACNIISSTCYSCTKGWQCNNQHDLKRASRPSFCCTPEAFDEERCDLIGTCKE